MKYQIEIGSPPEYEELVAYIIIDDVEVALINKERGPENMEIEFLDCQDIKHIPLLLFMEAIEKSRKALSV